VTFSAGIDEPLRLTSREATGLLIALRALADIPGVVDPAAARSAIAKIESAAGTAGPDHTHAPAADDEPAPMENEIAATVRSAVRGERALAIDYYSASHDTLSSRVVDPIRVVLIGDHCYLEAWSREAEGVRLFRFDRIVEATVLDEAALPPKQAVQSGPDTSLFDADPALPAATLVLAPSAAWMREYYPVRVNREFPDGGCEVAMTYASDEWLARLILGLGAEVRVIAPDSLAQRVREAADAALAAYAAVAADAAYAAVAADAGCAAVDADADMDV
jgi:proteasome accessory factor C